MPYNLETTRILHSEDGYVAITEGGSEDDPIEEVARRDLDPGTRYWIVDFETLERLRTELEDPIMNDDFGDALELDEDALGPPTGVAIGFEAWCAENGIEIEEE